MPIEMPEGVKYLELTPEKIQTLWASYNGIRGLCDDYNKDRFDLFLARLQNKNNIWLETTDGKGVLYLTEVIPNLSASAHFIFWDQKLRGRESFILDVLHWVMHAVNLQKINAFIPQYARVAIHFAKKLGFQYEGMLRRASYSNNKVFNMVILGMIKEEVDDGWIRAIGDRSGA